METTTEETEDVALSSAEDIDVAASSLKAIAHPLRLKILCILAGVPEVNVQDIVDRVGTTQSNISQHLSIMREKGIISFRKNANKVFYRIADPSVLDFVHGLSKVFCR